MSLGQQYCIEDDTEMFMEFRHLLQILELPVGLKAGTVLSRNVQKKKEIEKKSYGQI